MNIFSLCNLFKRILCRFLYLAACVLLHTELIRGAQCLCLSIVLSGERTGPWFAVVVYIALVNRKYIAERELLEYYTERRTATHLRSINKINFPRFYQEEENKQSGKSKYKHMIYFNRHVKKISCIYARVPSMNLRPERWLAAATCCRHSNFPREKSVTIPR